MWRKIFKVWKLERKKNEEIKGRISSSSLISVYTIQLPTVHVCTKFQSSRPHSSEKSVTKIFRNDWITEWQNYRVTEGQGKSSKAPTFSKRGYNKERERERERERKREREREREREKEREIDRSEGFGLQKSTRIVYIKTTIYLMLFQMFTSSFLEATTIWIPRYIFIILNHGNWPSERTMDRKCMS